MNTAPASYKIFLLILLVCLLGSPTTIQAEEDGDPDGTRLKAALMENPEVPKELKEAALGGTLTPSEINFLCAVEVVSCVGALVWDYRRVHDKCEHKFKRVDDYCAYYSQECGYGIWRPDCILNKKKCLDGTP